MIKKWILKFGIEARHRLMITISITGLLIMGYVGIYFFQTARVMNTLYNALRLHNITYYEAVCDFYQYIDNKDSVLYIESQNKFDHANYLASTFSYTSKSLDSMTKEQYIDYLYNATPETFNNIKKNARMMASRLRMMNTFKIGILNKTFEVAGLGYEKGSEVQRIIKEYKENEDKSLLIELDSAMAEMNVFFKQFADTVYEMNQFVRKFLVWGIIIILIIVIGLTTIITYMISNTITKPLLQLDANVKKIAKGDLEVAFKSESSDEIASLASSMNEMVDNLKKITEQANTISAGDYSKNLEHRSEQDILGKAIQKMTISLRNFTTENERDKWLRTGENNLNDVMRGDQDVQSLSRNIITFIAKYLNARMGVVYLTDFESNELRLTGSYAFTNRKGLNNVFRFGEGLVGQAALEKEMISITEVPDDYLRISSGLGEAYPGNIVVMPVIFEGLVIGVIELASFSIFDEYKLEFLKIALENVGITLNTAYARTELQKLLAKTQEQAEELQSQQEELRQTNEELEEQARALKESEQQLQQQQEELRVTNEELEERTLAIEKQRDELTKRNNDLKKAQEDIEKKAIELEQASRYKSEFLANVSHELRTPLNSILVLSQLMAKNKDGLLNEKHIQAANTIYSSGNSLLSLINEILDLSKVESGKYDINIEEINIKDFIHEIEAAFQPLAHDKNVEFKVVIKDNIPEVIHTDYLRAQQILRNLLSNAIKFTQKGKITLEIFVPGKDVVYNKKDLYQQKVIALNVSDTGIGIPQEKLELIFEAFRQADGTTTRRFGGTGLGLTISRSFAEILGGEIQLSSEENVGTVFTFYLPINAPVKRETEVPVFSQDVVISESISNKKIEKPIKMIPVDLRSEHQASEIKDDRKNINKGDKIILIIEDDANFSQILMELAHDRSFKCIIARNGETGLHYADFYKPHAVILDIGLPGIDGWEVMDNLKANPETRHIAVHFVSGKEHNIEAMKKGAIGFLKKPVSTEDLDNAFDRIEGIISKPLKRVLVVEDDDIMRHGIEELISDKDVVVSSVSKGEEAYHLLLKESFDCMILDLGLKDISGFELLKKLGKKSEVARMPIIIYTGKDLSKEEEEKLQQYSDRIIIKGVRSPERLLAETTLFLHKVESDMTEEKQQMLKVVRNKEDVMKDKKILIVDDDMRNVFALTSLLEERGVKIEVGRNGKEGIDKLEKSLDIDLVLMDIMMPEMNGYEAMEIIRKNPLFKNLPIIALTAKAMQGDKEKCIKAGANDYLTKPVDNDKLLSLLRVWLYR